MAKASCDANALTRRRPSFLRVPQHCLRCFKGLSVAAKCGLFLIMLNVPFGWGGGLLCAAICACTGDVRWGKAGCVVYAVSWGMLGLGMLLAGREVAKRFGVRFRSAWRAWRRGLGWKFFR